jgi:hypothetical protein
MAKFYIHLRNRDKVAKDDVGIDLPTWHKPVKRHCFLFASYWPKTYMRIPRHRWRLP